MSPFLLLLPAVAAAGPVMPERDWDVQHLDLAVRLDPGEERVTGTATHTVTPLGRRAGHLRLHQVALDIGEVRIDGEVVEGWRTRPGLLEIPMPIHGDRFDVAVTFEATPQTGLHWRGPDADRIREIWSHGQKDDNRHWFPAWDYPNDKYTYTGHITAPSDLVAVTNGSLAGREIPEEGWTTWTYQLEQPLATYLVSVAVGEYAVYPDAGAVPLEYIVPAYVDQQDTLDAAGITPPMLSWFEDTLQVDYPWPVYRQVWVQRFLYGAMENTTTTFHSDRLFRPSDGDRGALSERVIAHELAHQWFGDLVTCYGWRELWLNESFASYYAARWQRDHRGDDYFAADLWRWHQHAYAEPTALSVRDGSDPSSAGPPTLYSRGGIVLHGLERYLGTEAFDAGVTAYLRDHAHDLVESSDLRRALEDASGTHLGWYFEQLVYKDRFAEVRTSWSWSDGELEVVLDQLVEDEALRLPVQIEIGTGGATRRHRVWLDEGQTRLVVVLDEAPDWVAVDPDGTTLAHWDHQQPITAWTAQLRGSPSLYARLVAADAMAEAGAGGEPVEPLVESLRDGNLSGHYRAHFAHALGRIGTERAVEGLLGSLADSSPRARQAIVDALGGAPTYDGVARALEGRYRADRDGQVRAAALEALASHDQGRALFIARRRVNQPETGVGPWEVQVAAGLLGQHGEARDVGDLLQLTAPHLPHPARIAALSATTRLLDEIERDQREDRLRAKVSRRLADLLDDGDLRVVRMAIALLGKAGDDQASRILRAFAAEADVDTLREDARVAANAIRKRLDADPEAEGPPPGPDNERLQERLDDIEERVEDLETWRR